MPLAIVAGIPISYDKRLQDYLENNRTSILEGWSIAWSRARGKSAASLELHDVWRIIEERGSEQIHVFGFRGRPNRADVQDQLLPFCRFRWIDNELLSFARTQPSEFIKRLNIELKVEDEWRVRLAPADHRAAILLPRPSFETDIDIWRQVENAVTAARV